MPILAAIPFAAGLGGALGVSAAAGGALIAGGLTAAGIAAANAASQKAAVKKAANNSASSTPDATQIVGGNPTNTTANANNFGRAALISTSPSGVEGSDPTGRRRLIGND